MKNHYDVLELDKNCTAKEVKDSYIKLSKKYHPDKNKSDEAQKKILEINEAYAVLKNASSRYMYDRRLESKAQQQMYEQNFYQNRKHNYNKPRNYEEYMHYYQKMNNRAEPSNISRFTIVLCCCVLMVFGAGLRIMAESYRRRSVSQETAKTFSETAEYRANPKTENFRKMWERKRKREMEMEKKKSSES